VLLFALIVVVVIRQLLDVVEQFLFISRIGADLWQLSVTMILMVFTFRQFDTILVK
jgi:hypothetical protein